MIDYEKMSNFEINQRIAKIGCPSQIIEWLPQKSAYDFLDTDLMDNACYLITSMGHEQKVDFCNNPSDMMPLCFEHGIELSPLFSGEWCASYIKSYTFDEEPIYDGKYQSVHKNGLRAAAIVYLKMMESEK